MLVINIFQIDLPEDVCFTSACYRNGASAYGIFITVIYVQTAGVDIPGQNLDNLGF